MDGQLLRQQANKNEGEVTNEKRNKAEHNNTLL